MAEEYERHARFHYRNNSNLVLHREGPITSNEPTGEPESLVGKISYKMGDRVELTKPKVPAGKPKAKSRPKLDITLGQSVLSVKYNQGYQPSSSKTKKIYEQLLALVQKLMGDQPFEVLTDAANEIIFLLRGGGGLAELKEVVGGLSDSDFETLSVMCRELSDFDSVVADAHEDAQGVSLLFDDDDEGEEGLGEPELELEEVELDSGAAEASGARGCIRMGVTEADVAVDEHKIAVSSIDSHWLQRELNRLYNNPEFTVSLERQLLSILPIEDIQECENKMVTLLNYENFDFCKRLLRNRWQVYYCTRLGQAQSDSEAEEVRREMALTPAGQSVLEELRQCSASRSLEDERVRNLRAEVASLRHRASADGIHSTHDQENQATEENQDYLTLSLEKYAFSEGAQFMSNEKVLLPEGSEREETKEHSKVTIPPPPKPDTTVQLVQISSLPPWAQPAFTVAKIERLNPVQSTVCQVAFGLYDENMLVCAPTGAGKTNVAILAILNAVGRSLELSSDSEAPVLRGKPPFLIAYISPMKSLVSEQTQSFSQRLAPYGMRVEELTGDASVSKSQLENTHVVVATPEKFDVVTRKSGNEPLLERLRLVIIDEIHLLHDTRGPVLEAIVARLMCRQEHVRFVGLSATLPNYEDVARFLRVDPGKGLFYFGAHFRPVPLEQVYYGVKEKKAVKRFNAVNEILYNEVMGEVASCQILVFVHSRKETYRTAKFLKDTALSRDSLGIFVPEGSSREILASEAQNARSAHLAELLPFGLAIHHAGLERNDRQLVEDLFADRHVQVLVSTATLAWGVNLPAHTVIIKGTQVFSPERGEWTELCPLHVTQMLGRAGRPQYDVKGRGVIITELPNLQFYLSLNNHQLPIESQLVSQLPSVLNAEVASRNVASAGDCLEFIRHTYLYVRLTSSPKVYLGRAHQAQSEAPADCDAIDLDTTSADADANAQRFIGAALAQLAQLGMARYEPKSKAIQPTFLGTIASHYYLHPESVAAYATHLKPEMADSDLLKLFSLSHEFRHVPVREHEAVELGLLAEKVPIPVKGSHTEASAKIAILLQAYISRLKLEGYALVSEMTFIRQNSTRIMRAFFEIALKRGWADAAERALHFAKCVEWQMWASSSPLRQVPAVPLDIVRRLERKDLPFDRYYDLSALDLGELVRNPQCGELLFKAVHCVPRLEAQVYLQPVSRSRVAVELNVLPSFVWDPACHGRAERFWLLVEDVDSQKILYHDLIQIERGASEKVFNFTVPIGEPLPPNYYLKLISDRWVVSETCTSIGFSKLVMAADACKHTQLLDLVPLPLSSSSVGAVFRRYLAGLPKYAALGLQDAAGELVFDPIHTQVFEALVGSENVLLCLPPLTGQRLCIDLAILARIFSQEGNFTDTGTSATGAVALMATGERAARAHHELYSSFMGNAGDIEVALLTGDVRADCAKLARSHLVIGTPAQFEGLFRRWKSREVFQQIALFIVDGLHMVSDPQVGPDLEVCVSRLRFASAQLGLSPRIVALSSPLGNAPDLANWIGATKVFNFSTDARKTPLALTIRSVESLEREERLLSISKLMAAERLYPCGPPSEGVIIFCTDAADTRVTAVDAAIKRQRKLASHSASGSSSAVEEASLFEEGVVEEAEFSERALVETLRSGVGYIHRYTPDREFRLLETLFACGVVCTLVVDQEVAEDLRVFAPSVVVKDTKVLTPVFTPVQLELPCVGVCETDYSPSRLLHLLSTADSSRSGPEFLPLPPTSATSGPGPNLSSLADRFLAHNMKTGKLTNWQTGKLANWQTGNPGKCVLFTPNSLKDYYKTALFEAMPAESTLETRLEEHINAEVALGTIETQQDALDWLTWTLFYRRLAKNPNFYGLAAASHELLCDHLSELVESTLESLEKMQLLELSQDGSVSPLNLGLVAAYYCLRCETMDLFSRAVQPNFTRKLLITVICAACEVERLPLRRNEEHAINRIARRLEMATLEHNAVFVNPHFKASVLLRAHMCRLQLPRDLARDTQFMLPLFLRLAHALVDVISSNMWLTPALVVMETCQLVVQALDSADSPLLQLPHFDVQLCEALAQEFGVKDVLDFISMDDVSRDRVLERFTDSERADIANACNAYPVLQLSFSLDVDKVEPGGAIKITVEISRDIEAGAVSCPFVEAEKREEWWLVVGDPKENALYGIKRVAASAKQVTTVLEIDAPSQSGDHKLSLYLMSDSYVGCDQELEIPIHVT